MRPLTPFLALLLLTPLPHLPAQAEEPSTTPARNQRPLPEGLTPKARETFEALQNLSEEDRTTFTNHLLEANRLQNPENKRILEALIEIYAAEQILPYHLDVLLLKGASLVQIRDFDRAAEYFDTANEIYPNRWELAFNRAEMDFVRGNWQEAYERFSSFIQTFSEIIPEDTRKICEYKVILTLLQLGKRDSALREINHYDIYDSSPIYYYSMAAYHFSLDEEAEAIEWMRHARRIYPDAYRVLYEDSLAEIGWVTIL